MRLLIKGESLIEKKDELVSKIVSLVNKNSGLNHSFILDEANNKIEFSWVKSNGVSTLFIAPEILNFDESDYVESESTEEISYSASELPNILVSEDMMNEISELSVDSSWKRRAWEGISIFANTPLDSYRYVITFWCSIPKDPEHPEKGVGRGEVYIQTYLTSEDEGNTLIARCAKDSEDFKRVKLLY